MCFCSRQSYIQEKCLVETFTSDPVPIWKGTDPCTISCSASLIRFQCSKINPILVRLKFFSSNSIANREHDHACDAVPVKSIGKGWQYHFVSDWTIEDHQHMELCPLSFSNPNKHPDCSEEWRTDLKT
jgi:hypothetical protein